VSSDAAHPLEIERVTLDGQEVLRVRGEVDLRTAPEFRRFLAGEARHVQGGRMLLDLARVAYMDSSGIGTLVYVKRELERNGGRLILIGLTSQVRSLFQVTQLERFFTIVSSLGEVPKP